MTRSALLGLGLAGLFMGGCHAATRMAEVPRVDLALEGGNRGYLLGSPPALSDVARKTTRQMVQTDLEIPSFYRPTQTGASVNIDVTVLQPSSRQPVGHPAPAAQETYVVQRGDTLSGIAAKVYGSGRRWRRLLEANERFLHGNPKRLRVGMKLVIPRGESAPSQAPAASSSSEDEGLTFKK